MQKVAGTPAFFMFRKNLEIIWKDKSEKFILFC